MLYVFFKKIKTFFLQKYTPTIPLQLHQKKLIREMCLKKLPFFKEKMPKFWKKYSSETRQNCQKTEL